MTSQPGLSHITIPDLSVFDNLYRAVAYSETSEGAEHWRAGKLIMSRAQIWP